MRSLIRRSSLSSVWALASVALFAGCEQPVRPANGPTPRQLMVSQALNVPVATVQAFDDGAVGTAGASASRPDPSSAQAQRLRRALELLAQARSAGEAAKP